MPRKYQPAILPDGSRNPKHKTRPTGSRGKKKNHFAFGQFCAWDGEGVTMGENDHRYVLLANSQGDAVWNDAGLGTLEIFGIIAARARALDSRTIHVVFGGSYDMNCWLKDLSVQSLARIWAGKWTNLGGSFDDPWYRVQYRPRRSFVIHELKTGTRVTLWDVWGFFQGSFVGALEKYELPVPEQLRKMKLHRRAFKTRERKKIVAYCREECALLVELMRKVHEYLTLAELPIRRWDGAGACAAALLGREKTQAHQGESPDAVRTAAQHAYAGGRIELLRYGHSVGVPLHHYDINSAYPSALRDVPSLAQGKWSHCTDYFDDLPSFTLFKVKWDFAYSTCRAFPFFWRAPTGAIYYPPFGEGWYWRPEVEAAYAAIKAGALVGTLDIQEAWSYWPETDARPFAFVDRLFAQRAEWKREKIGAEKMLKLALNSLYGKCAQHVGGREGEAPRYHQLEWAGWITSQTRAALYRAAIEAGEHAVMIATDGIFSTELLGGCRVSKNLGDWDYQMHQGATVVQSGVYWLDDEDGTTAGFSRGFDKGSLDRGRIVKAWRERKSTLDASLTRFVTMGSVVNRHSPFAHWRQWKTAPRILALTPGGTKRTDKIPMARWVRKSGFHPSYGFIPTVATIPAALLVGDRMSGKYPLPWVGDTVLPESPKVKESRFIEWEAMEE